MNFLLVKPHLPLKVARQLHEMLHLEPYELELVAGGIDSKHHIEILDLSLEKRPEHIFQQKIKERAFDLIGFTAYSNQAKNVLKLSAIAKKESPKTKIIVGGIHATIAPDYFRNSENIDALVRGEGGTTIKELVDKLENSGTIPENERIIPVGSENFDELIKLPPPPLPYYEEIPKPRRDLVDPQKYFCVWTGAHKEKMNTFYPPVATVRSSMGCPHRCNFCVVHYLANGKYRQRTPEDVVEEIANLEQNHIYFVDDEMFINAKRTRKIAELLKAKGINKKYISWARSDTICANKELFKIWHEVGLSTLYVGMESMEDKTLNDYNKGYTPDTNRKAVGILKDIGICLHAAFMVNPDFVKEDFEKLQQTVKSILPAEVSFTVFSPAPGTELWEKHKDDFIVDPYQYYDCMHTILPLKLPMKKFYHYFSLLSLTAFRNNPWRARKIKAPFKDIVRLFYTGFLYYNSLRKIYKDYYNDYK